MTDAELKDLCSKINSDINNRMTWTSDMETANVPDFWSVMREKGALKGDCDDYMLTKRAYLLDAGVPHELMFLQLCWVETGEYHAVLRVRGAETDWILDNRQGLIDTPASLQQHGYKWTMHIRSDGEGGWFYSTGPEMS